MNPSTYRLGRVFTLFLETGALYILFWVCINYRINFFQTFLI